jgi:hypothetical protein
VRVWASWQPQPHAFVSTHARLCCSDDAVTSPDTLHSYCFTAATDSSTDATYTRRRDDTCPTTHDTRSHTTDTAIALPQHRVINAAHTTAAYQHEREPTARHATAQQRVAAATTWITVALAPTHRGRCTRRQSPQTLLLRDGRHTNITHTHTPLTTTTTQRQRHETASPATQHARRSHRPPRLLRVHRTQHTRVAHLRNTHKGDRE